MTVTDPQPGTTSAHNVMVSGNVTDNLSGVAQTYYTTNGSTPTTGSATGTSVVLSAPGTYTIRYFSVDVAGNVEAAKTAGTVIRIDNVVPTLATTFDAGALDILRELAPGVPRGLLTWLDFPIGQAVAAAGHLDVQVLAAHWGSLRRPNQPPARVTAADAA